METENETNVEIDLLDEVKAIAAGLEESAREVLMALITSVEWGRRRDEVLADTLSDLRAEYFQLAVETSKQADNCVILDRRTELRKMETQAKNKVRYIENVLAYTGEKVLKKPVAPTRRH